MGTVFCKVGQFMMPEGNKTLILAFRCTSKTGQSVAHNRHRIFLLGFFVREDMFRHFIGLISDSRLQAYSRWNKTNRNFSIDF